jgi:glycosyltransferase involved in cell wall biosynthesis
MKKLPEILFISTYPPRECGIATYTHDLVQAIREKYRDNFEISICALENLDQAHEYKSNPDHILVTDETKSYTALSQKLLSDENIKLVVLQHEFGLFESHKNVLAYLIETIPQPVIIAFHTVLPRPNAELQSVVQNYATHAAGLIVMTKSSAQILVDDYTINPAKITVIPHGTHLLEHTNKDELKATYQVDGNSILSTFGFIGLSKSIETTLQALPAISQKIPNVLFLIIGKTHPNTVAKEGETYRRYLEEMIHDLGMQQHVRWINYFLPTLELLDYLTLTDIYLFTSNDPNQAVSGTFSYAISSGCPVISTRIPHVTEVLKPEMGVLIDFNQPAQLADAAIQLLENEPLRIQMRVNSLQSMAFSAWENSAILHVNLFQKMSPGIFSFHFKWPTINLLQIKRLTTHFGMIQFSHINEPDLSSGYTIDDNARALIVMVEQFVESQSSYELNLIQIYLDFIGFCQQENGSFLNYVSIEKKFTAQNEECNLEDSIGRTIWALGFVLSKRENLPSSIVSQAEKILQKSLPSIKNMHSTRAMAFLIKGIYYANQPENEGLLTVFADRLAAMYAHESAEGWEWFEHSLTYANSLLPEAMLLAGIATGNREYQQIALQSFEFLLKHIFDSEGIHVISNEYWSENDKKPYQAHTKALSQVGGEQAIDVSYTILALSAFYQVYLDENYRDKMQLAFDWFLGRNHLNQIMYNPCTGGCYDGLERNNVNLNQGAESTISYLLARQTMEKIKHTSLKIRLKTASL